VPLRLISLGLAASLMGLEPGFFNCLPTGEYGRSFGFRGLGGPFADPRGDGVYRGSGLGCIRVQRAR